ncbi:MAG: Transcriptional regulator, lrp family [archaeon GW2011_AR20]|nr:MAG: Transcriptional regulator, lrp family [archaeon GW2011_AR20]MBS3160808.1 Lrp/AsnC family transcriptional regulator [Candidatus Woesearchaeota archaeon]
MKLDKKDLKILEILKENSKLTTSQIYKKTNIPITTVHNRIKKLENLGIIRSYTLKLDYNKLGKPITGFILVTINYILPDGTKIKQEHVAQEISKLEGVEEVNIMTGATDILIKVRVSSIEELNEFVIKKLRNINGVDKTQTMITLSSY